MFDPHSSDNSYHVERGVSASGNGIKIVLRIAAILCMLFVHCSISQYKVSTQSPKANTRLLVLDKVF
jgi:hypothetical protein